MAEHRPSVPARIRRRLLDQAGGRCANPGCPNDRPQMHHIDQWAVYHTHDETTMVMICPSCHDVVHHGSIAITDETILRWKAAGKKPRTNDVIFVEPGSNPLVRLGKEEVVVGHGDGMVVFNPSEGTRLSFRIEEQDLALLNVELRDRVGQPIVRVTDNRVRLFQGEAFTYERIPGHILVTGPVTALLDDWMISGIRSRHPTFGDGPEVIFEVEVVAAGQVNIRGIFANDDRAIVIQDEGWTIPRSESAAMLFIGYGKVVWLNPSIDFGFFETAFKLW